MAEDLSVEELLQELDMLENRGVNIDDLYTAAELDLSDSVVLQGLPVAPAEKLKKLELFLKKKVASAAGAEPTELTVSTDESGASVGTACARFSSRRVASAAVKKLDNLPFDKRHNLRAFPLSQVEEIFNAPDMEEEKESFPEVEQLEKLAETPTDTWLGDEDGRDQFVLRYERETEVFYMGPADPPALDYDGDDYKRQGKAWCTGGVKWSPLGSFLATFTKRGIALWGGEKWGQLGRFAHTGVEQVEFSSKEWYMATWNGKVGPRAKSAIIVWDIRTCVPVRRLAHTPPKNAPVWPGITWSGNQKLFARAAEDRLEVYEMPTGGLLNKKPFPAPRIVECSFSPRGALLAYWCRESGNTAASVTVLQLPSGRTVGRKNVFGVENISLHWHPSGDFLAAHFTRKQGKASFPELALFRVLDASVPVDSLTLTPEDSLLNLAWEPDGARFSLVRERNSVRTVHFYTLGRARKGKDLTELFVLDETRLNRSRIDLVSWSPRGQYCVITDTHGSANTPIFFFDVNSDQVISEEEGHQIRQVHWDTAGRVVATLSCRDLMDPTSTVPGDPGFKLWSFQGTELFERHVPGMVQMLWRPRPPLLLNAEKRKDVLKSLDRYAKRFEERDSRRSRRRLAAAHEDLRAAVTEYFEAKYDNEETDEAVMTWIEEQRGGYKFPTYEFVEVEFEEPIAQIGAAQVVASLEE